MPDGKPLVIRFSSTERDRQYDELMKRSLDSIAIRMEIHKDRFPELLKLERRCRIMMRNAAWIADYPDGDNFMQLLYGPNTSRATMRVTDRPSSTSSTRNPGRCPTARAQQALLGDGAQDGGRYGLDHDDSRVRNMLMQPQVIGFRGIRLCITNGCTRPRFERRK